MKSIKSPISLDRQKQRQIKSRYPFAITAVIFVVVCLGVFLILASSIRVSGLDKQTALLEKYGGLSDLANDIRNGSVDFANLDDSDGIAAQVMKNSRLYEKADTATKECLDFAGKLGKSLGDHEIVHCVDDSNYFRNKYANSSLSAGDALSALHSTQDKDKVPLAKILYDSDNFADKLVLTGKFNEQEAEQFSGKIKQIIAHLQIPNSDITESFEANGQASLTVQQESNRSPTANQPFDNPIIQKLVKTGKFTEQEAGEFANKIRLKGIEIEELTNVNLSDSGTSIKQIPPAQDAKNELPTSPQNYNDLPRLVSDIKNRHLDADRISLNAFQVSGAYKTADKQTQACIDHAGKIGHNLRDTEIVNCFEDANHFGNLLSSNTESSKNTSSSASSAQSPNHPITKAAENKVRANNQENDSSSTRIIQTSDNERTKLIDKLVQSGKFTEAEATEFVIIHELVNNENFSEEQAVNFAHNIMKDKKQSINQNDNSKVKSGIDKNSDSDIDGQSAADRSVNDKARSGDDNRNKDNSVTQENESPASSARDDDDNSAVDDKTGNKGVLNENDIEDDEKGKTNSAVSSKHNDTAEGKKTETDALSKETSGDNNDKELIEKLVGTGKFTEQEAKEFADKKAEKGP
jgi:polyhydroxyalkanoate synthesis regulator phasin